MNDSEFWNRGNEIDREGRTEARTHNYAPDDRRPTPQEIAREVEDAGPNNRFNTREGDDPTALAAALIAAYRHTQAVSNG